jgi:NADPH:quinone reductase
MRAIITTRNGGPEVLELQDVPEPAPGENELLVRIEAAGVNYRDIYDREGDYGGGSPPKGMGIEGAGVVEQGAGEFSEGDRVCWTRANGSYAEKVIVAVDQALPVPDGVSAEQAAGVLLQGMTAQYLARDVHPVQPGDWVVVHAAAGGVGLLLTQIVKLLGGHVLGTTSSAEKAQLARDAGADEVCGYDEFVERAKALTDGVGVAAVYDGVGKSTFLRGFDALRPRGMMALFGAASGRPEPFDPDVLSRGAYFLTRPGLPRYTATREELLSRSNEVLGWVAAGKLDVRIGGRYPLEQARQAQEDLAARKTTGKLLIVP